MKPTIGEISTNASVKNAFKKWKETTRASNQRARAGSAFTIDTSQRFEEFDHHTSSDSEADDMSSSVTTSSSLRRYGSRILINGSTRSSVTNPEADSWSSNEGEDDGDEDDEYEDGEEDDEDNISFRSFEGVHIHTPEEDEEDENDHGSSRASLEADNDPLPLDICEGCQQQQSDVGVLSWCNICCIVLCDSCWTTQAAHKINARNRSRRSHEKTDLRLWEIISSILNPETDSKRQEQLHKDNFDTKWFGVEFDDNSRKPCFHDYGRYVKLASETEMEPGTQHPSITCFVGETGHGKSTLINALMKINRHTSLAPDQVPVMGTSLTEIDAPTSDAVHLFADPITYNTNRPYFYADCEGLSGGNKVPMATRAYQGVKNFRQKRRHARNDIGDNGITWARGPEKSRQWMVENLYPRVLFTFSDVVCFVTKNFRALESVISKLIRWADKVFQQSVNQPVLPYAVIVVNALEVSDITSPWWDIDGTTGDQLKKRADCIINDPFMMKCVEKWRNLGKTINNLEELLMCYYSGIKIVCIPHAKESPAVIEQQYKVLYKIMEEGSRKAYDLRIKAGLLMTSEELDIYLRHAFHHFSKNPSKPFNFLAAAFHHNPVSSTFKDHIAKAAVHIMSQSPQMSGTEMFKLLAPLVASCILLDAFRSRYPHGGQAATIFPLYQQFCDDALAEVYEKHWRCEIRDKKGRRCANVATGHSKGHQLEDGKVFGVGEFSSAYIENASKEKVNFISTISSELDRLLKEFSAGQDISVVAQYHQNHVLSRYVRYWNWKGNVSHEDDDIAPLTAHTTCFSCLSGTPIHALTCGHIICERCAENYSTLSSSGFWREIRICPLCSNMENPWEIPWKYKARPKHTGLRVLSLDGGGIRGVIQLKMLEALERKINLGVPIQEFFDLVVGTSSGGIIALALASKRVSVTECINLFCDFSEQAFQKRTGADLPGIKTLVEATYHSKYETRGIDRVLKESFGDESIFGGSREPGGQEMLRAGVTTISSSGHPYLVANYNRPLTEDLKIKYNFLRAENSHQELKTWEAARATSAAPRFFKPFFHKPTGYSFNDGGLKFNNPVVVADQEWKLLWPNLANKHPDILLSIGTGFDPITKPDMDKQGRRLRAKRGALEFAKVLLKIATQQIESSVGCEQTWSNFLRSLPIQDEDKVAKYHRLNIDLPNKLPRIDGVDQMETLKRATEDFCYSNPLIDQIATKLIASLFYFRLDGASRATQGIKKWDCEGTILCRLEPGSDALRRLCKRLETRRNGPPRRNHLFFMNERRNSRGAPDQQLTPEDSLFEDVTKGKQFEMKINFSMFGPEDSMRIFLSLSDKECDVSLISGFPCRILKEHEGYRPLARMDSARTQRGHKSKTPSFYSAMSANSSASSLSGIFRGVTKTGARNTSY